MGFYQQIKNRIQHIYTKHKPEKVTFEIDFS